MRQEKALLRYSYVEACLSNKNLQSRPPQQRQWCRLSVKENLPVHTLAWKQTIWYETLMDAIPYLTILSETVGKVDRLNIPRKFFGQVLLCQLVSRRVPKAAPFSLLDGSVDFLHPVVPDILWACFHPVKVTQLFYFQKFDLKVLPSSKFSPESSSPGFHLKLLLQIYILGDAQGHTCQLEAIPYLKSSRGILKIDIQLLFKIRLLTTLR